MDQYPCNGARAADFSRDSALAGAVPCASRRPAEIRSGATMQPGEAEIVSTWRLINFPMYSASYRLARRIGQRAG
jgi:hypothetical protein